MSQVCSSVQQSGICGEGNSTILIIMVGSVPGSQQPLGLACVDAEGKLNLEERRGKYRLR